MNCNLWEFKASRVRCNRIVDMIDATGLSGEDVADIVAGGAVALHVYADGYWIEEHNDGSFYLILGRDEWTTTDLADLERRLWAYAAMEWGSIEGSKAYRALVGEFLKAHPDCAVGMIVAGHCPNVCDAPEMDVFNRWHEDIVYGDQKLGIFQQKRQREK